MIETLQRLGLHTSDWPRVVAEELAGLRAARAKLAQPGGWTQFAWARDQYGRPCAYWEPQAVRWCAAGAILAGGSCCSSRWRALEMALPDGFEALGPFNDTRGSVADVIDLYDRAIAILEALLQGAPESEAR